jgi:hypothetical protein
MNKKNTPVLLFTLFAMCGCGHHGPADLTGASDDVFKSNLNRGVTLTGQLEVGKLGLCLFDSTPDDVVFYIKPKPFEGIYKFPESWMRYRGKKVRLTGTLYFQDYPEVKWDPQRPVGIAPDHYYMVLEDTKLEAIPIK